MMVISVGLDADAVSTYNRALQTAINAFGRFVAAEGASMGFIAASFVGAASGAVFMKPMYRFGVHLAFMEGRVGKPLAKNSVMSYLRHAKNWLLDTYPAHRATIEKKLLKMGQTLERHCLKRVDGGMVKKGPTCTKEDLRILMDGLYYDACSPKDYQNTVLLVLMRYAFGQASNIGFVVNGNLSASADGVVFVRLIRVKTAEEQYAPCPQLLDHPQLAASRYEHMNAPVDIPLAEALVVCEKIDEPSKPPKKKRKQTEDNMKFHAYSTAWSRPPQLFKQKRNQ
ncbi:unnamed protein product [Phytophthora fragariaefolia]|uniref:Unnamed protein product n=1 Tax=Phytophthora fragariaefolia TaxID=1490495 RepID=A0A9W6YD24_9STRA|nr:unnamed protein product [Phytophthora fragariaefolia]